MLQQSTTAKSADKLFEQRLQFLSTGTTQKQLALLQRGVEKEGLRVTRDGLLAQTPHPAALGSALTNSWITTDFSESLLEFITPVRNSAADVLGFLADTHSLAAQNLDNELIWAGSMPCILPADEQIPLAQYGTSNVALMKTAYRRGLGHRYGRAMQTVAGIHYNFSLPESYWSLEANSLGQQESPDKAYINRRYLDLVRNFRRNYWLLIYLFGAAPCADQSFVQQRSHNLEQLTSHDLFLPYATSLRMGDLGYQSIAQKSLFICYNELDSYIQTLAEAIQKPYPPYEVFGLDQDGEYQQLSTSLLQIENEFYSPIRPKRSAIAHEKPLNALSNRGIEYIEVRCMDINPLLPLGIDEQTMHFLDAFLLSCLIGDSPLCNEREFALIGENQARIVSQGRQPGIKVYCGDSEVPMEQCATAILKRVAQIAQVLDNANATNSYSHSVAAQLEKIRDPDKTPSAQLLTNMATEQVSYIDYMLEISAQFMRQHQSHHINSTQAQELIDIADASLRKQAVIENSDEVPFDVFLSNYFAT